MHVLLMTTHEQLGHEVYIVSINMDKVKYEYDAKEKELKVPGFNSGLYDNLTYGNKNI